jgi:hypothetical protein
MLPYINEIIHIYGLVMLTKEYMDVPGRCHHSPREGKAGILPGVAEKF